MCHNNQQTVGVSGRGGIREEVWPGLSVWGGESHLLIFWDDDWNNNNK